MYTITNHSRTQAKLLGVTIKISTRKNKKLDVFKEGKYVTSIGDTRYSDYPTYIKTRGKKYADERRRLYHLRHSDGFYSKKILW